MMLIPGTFLDLQWYRGQDARSAILSVLQRDFIKRKKFGLLEQPVINSQPNTESYKYKIFVSGKSSVGKTSTVAKLGGREIPTSHSETPGVQVSDVYWPAKILQYNKVVMFQLQFWDAGLNALKKYDHILPACKDKTDCVLFLFSFTDKSSFDDLPRQMARIIGPEDNLCKIVMGTKSDLQGQTEVTLRDVREFERNFQLPILHIENVPLFHPSETRTELGSVAPLLNVICEHLWHRDLILAGTLQPSPEMSEGMAFV